MIEQPRARQWEVVVFSSVFLLAVLSCGGSSAAHGEEAALQTSAPSNAERTMDADSDQAPPACQSKIYFDHGETELGAVAKSRIVAIASCIKERKIDEVLLEGRTDPHGSPEENRQLGLSRARAVGAALRAVGVADAEIEVVSSGAKNAATTLMRWSENRIVKVEAEAHPE